MGHRLIVLQLMKFKDHRKNAISKSDGTVNASAANLPAQSCPGFDLIRTREAYAFPIAWKKRHLGSSRHLQGPHHRLRLKKEERPYDLVLLEHKRRAAIKSRKGFTHSALPYIIYFETTISSSDLR